MSGGGRDEVGVSEMTTLLLQICKLHRTARAPLQTVCVCVCVSFFLSFFSVCLFLVEGSLSAPSPRQCSRQERTKKTQAFGTWAFNLHFAALADRQLC